MNKKANLPKPGDIVTCSGCGKKVQFKDIVMSYYMTPFFEILDEKDRKYYCSASCTGKEKK